MAGMFARYKIAVIQLYCEPLAPEINHKRACEFIRQAAAQDAQLAVLPEFHLNAWEPDRPEWSGQAANYKKYLDSYCSLAKESNICLVPGTLIEQHPSSTCLSDCPACPSSDHSKPVYRNIAYFIDNHGKILGYYQKKNLWHSERDHLTSVVETPHPVIDTPIGKVGMLACWDLAFPEAFRELIAGGANIIIIPSYWTWAESSDAGLKYNPNAEQLILNSFIVARCHENTCAVVFCNAGNPSTRRPENPKICVGESQITVPFVGPLAKLQDEEGMIVADIDMQVLADAESNYKIREDLARSDWHYVYRHNSFPKA